MPALHNLVSIYRICIIGYPHMGMTGWPFHVPFQFGATGNGTGRTAKEIFTRAGAK